MSTHRAQPRSPVCRAARRRHACTSIQRARSGEHPTLLYLSTARISGPRTWPVRAWKLRLPLLSTAAGGTSTSAAPDPFWQPVGYGVRSWWCFTPPWCSRLREAVPGPEALSLLTNRPDRCELPCTVRAAGRELDELPPEVRWGDINMVEAERRLLAHALLDHSNARFLLLSESHVPLFDFPTVYSYLINSTKVYVESNDELGMTGRGRYNRGMAPAVASWQWRKGSQWFELDRTLAANVIVDDVYFPVFKRFCKRKCCGEEHCLPTFLHIRQPAAVARQSVTWVDWSRGGPHPARFMRTQVTIDFLLWLRGGTTCEYNGRTTTICFLFARKFLPNSLTRFLRFAPKVKGFG